EDDNFLKFSAFLKIVVGNSICTDMLPAVVVLLRDYLLKFFKLYGSRNMRPNHHWAVHIPEQISLYGPLNGFWAFLTERLNKILKNLNSNNWTGGCLEVSMMREFHRSTRIDSVVCGTRPHSHASSTDLSVASSVKSHRTLFNVTRRRNLKGTLFNLSWVKTDNAEAIGTVQDAAHAGMLRWDSKLARKEPTVHFALDKVVGTTMLSPVVELHNFALLNGKRLIPTERSRRNTAGSSLIQFRYEGEAFAGEVRQILRHIQPEVPTSKNVILVHISWMKCSNLTPLDGGRFPWDNYPQLGAETWEYDTYTDPKDEDFPPIVLPLDEIHCQISRGKISHTKPPLWITTHDGSGTLILPFVLNVRSDAFLIQFPTSLLAYGFGDKVE
ncbi:hypothetical protein B0H14DRAFT_2378759, partial [Mycena olivaceomarginata]